MLRNVLGGIMGSKIFHSRYSVASLVGIRYPHKFIVQFGWGNLSLRLSVGGVNNNGW